MFRWSGTASQVSLSFRKAGCFIGRERYAKREYARGAALLYKTPQGYLETESSRRRKCNRLHIWYQWIWKDRTDIKIPENKKILVV